LPVEAGEEDLPVLVCVGVFGFKAIEVLKYLKNSIDLAEF
jgi:hypothetical protein